jgi:hypothetical protein
MKSELFKQISRNFFLLILPKSGLPSPPLQTLKMLVKRRL